MRRNSYRMQTARDCCPHGVPFRWPESCAECESEETHNEEDKANQ